MYESLDESIFATNREQQHNHKDSLDVPLELPTLRDYLRDLERHKFLYHYYDEGSYSS